MVPVTPRISIIYYLPNVHKSLNNPRGRHIVSGINSITSRIGKYVDVFLQPLVNTPAFLKDTMQIREIS